MGKCMETPISFQARGGRGGIGKKKFSVRAGIETPLSSLVENPGFSGKLKDNLIFLPRNWWIVGCGLSVESSGETREFYCINKRKEIEEKVLSSACIRALRPARCGHGKDILERINVIILFEPCGRTNPSPFLE